MVAGSIAGGITNTVLAQVQQDPLRFVADNQLTEQILTLPDGKSIKYRGYENIYYVADVVDSTYQYLNVYVPETAYEENRQTPIFLKTNVGGYMASKASAPSPTDATGRALLEGYVVVIPGSRGANSEITGTNGKAFYR
ncbi:MAG: hypothetical protein LUD02_07915 [Tannerellaceae bacterium]|nr:hypothetical protein [Tannerellaceae bacterium]